MRVDSSGFCMDMKLLTVARVISGVGNGAKSAGTATGTDTAASGFTSGFVSKFKGNSYVRDTVVNGDVRMDASGNVPCTLV